MVELFLDEARRFVNPGSGTDPDAAVPHLDDKPVPPRQRQVLACLLHGDSAKQVARRLGLSVHTVNEYVKALYRRFNVQSRAELMARFAGRS